MADVKIDTFRSSVHDKEFSGSETESETIDDFSQYSDQMNNTNRESLATDSRSTTPISKAIPIKINGDNNFQIHLQDSLNSSLNENKESSDDVMVQISRKTTIKKIISKTTLVNGVTQASEFEEFIIQDNHKDGNSNKLKDSKCESNHNYHDFQHLMNENYSNGAAYDGYHNDNGCCIDETIQATQAHNNFHERTTYVKSPESCISENNEKSKVFLLSNENHMEKSLNHSPKNEKDSHHKSLKVSENTNLDKRFENTNQNELQNFNDVEKTKLHKHSIISETNQISPLKQKNLMETNNTNSMLKNDKYPNREIECQSKSVNNRSSSPNHKICNIETNVKIDTNDNDFNDKIETKHDKRHFINYKSQDSHRKDYKFNNKKDHVSEKQKYIMSKRKEKDDVNKNKHRKYNDECDDFKCKPLQSKTQFHATNNTKFGTETTVMHMKWVDPLKSYHLKYDLKDNGRLMQQWIRQKQDALYRTDPNNKVKNSISKKGIKCRTTSFSKSFSKVPPTIKYNSQKDIKEFIVRGTIKENLFQIRHPYPTFEERKYIFYSPTNKRTFEFLELDKNMDFKSLGPYSLNHDEYKPKQRLHDSHKERRNNLTMKVSKVWNKFEPNENQMQEKQNNLMNRINNEELTYTPRNYYLPVSCCSNCCCYSIPCSCLIRKDKVLERYKYLSHERLDDKFYGESHITEYNDDSDRMSETDTFIEDEMKYKSKRSNNIDFLEAQLENIEDKIRNIKPNSERNVFQCAMDLECQCQEIEQQLEYLYKIPKHI